MCLVVVAVGSQLMFVFMTMLLLFVHRPHNGRERLAETWQVTSLRQQARHALTEGQFFI
jgi:hypothetical protein